MSAIDDLKNAAQPQKKGFVNGVKVKKRTAVSVDTIKNTLAPDSPEEEKGEQPKDYVEDILNVDNPDSMFMQHVKEKQEEAQRWMAEKQEEAAENAFLAENGEEVNAVNPVEVLSKSGFEIPEEEDTDDYTVTNTGFNEADAISLEIDPVEEEASEVAVDPEPVATEAPVEEVAVKPEPVVEQPVIEEVPVKKEEQPEEKISYTADVKIETGVSKETVKEDTTEEDEEEEDIDATTKEQEERFKRLQKIVADRLKPASLGLDLSSFTIVKDVNDNMNEILDSHNSRVTKWVVMAQEAVIYMREFSGAELELMMEYYNAFSNSVRLNSNPAYRGSIPVDTRSARQMYKMIYDHLEGSKPANFATWMKLTPVSAIDDYFFAIYLSSFLGTNFIPIDCANPDCNESYVTDDIDIMKNMVKFSSKEIKEKFTRIYSSQNSISTKPSYVTEAIPLTNLVAISFKEPSIEDSLKNYEIDNRTREDYVYLVPIMPYIDEVYKINTSTKTLAPIKYKQVREDPVKTMRFRIRKYDNIFKAIGPDAFTPIKAYVGAITDRTTREIDYVTPETKCPLCGHVNPEVSIPTGEVADMVFTRCQLGALVSTSIS